LQSISVSIEDQFAGKHCLVGKASVRSPIRFPTPPKTLGENRPEKAQNGGIDVSAVF
jgi:hypothetical protein